MKKQKTALITGIGGQDGSYLAELLLSKGTKVRGIVRRSSNPNTDRIYHLMKKYGEKKYKDSLFYCQYADLTDASSIRSILDEFQPDEIYNLAAQSHVGVSFYNPISTFDINALGSLRILDAIREMKLNCKYYQASSSEMFGRMVENPANENTPFYPRSPYGISKLYGHWITKNYRESYNMFTTSPNYKVMNKICLALSNYNEFLTEICKEIRPQIHNQYILNLHYQGCLDLSYFQLN